MRGRGAPGPFADSQTLWERVEHNRRRLVWTALLFLGVGAVCAYLMGWVVAIVVGIAVLRSGSLVLIDSVWRALPLVAAGVCALGVTTALAWCAAAVAFSDKLTLRLLGAVRVPPGEMPEMKKALKDMAIAAGLPVAPEPYCLEVSGINAGVVARAGRRPVLVFTRGFAKLDPALQRAVFSNLVARVATGDAAWGTVGAALAGPAFTLRDHDLRRGEAVLIPDDDGRRRSGADYSGDAAILGIIGFVLYVPFIVVTQVMAGVYRHDSDIMAEAADAQGMLLLKDPRTALEALERVLPADNCVPGAGGAFGLLFYAWPDWEAPIGAGDPEMRRVARLRQVLGAEGLATQPVG